MLLRTRVTSQAGLEKQLNNQSKWQQIFYPGFFLPRQDRRLFTKQSGNTSSPPIIQILKKGLAWL